MPLRELRLPQDLIPLADLIARAFHYPENPAWDVQVDEVEEMVDTFTRLKRSWPLIRPLMLLSPTLRDILHGFIWEEDGLAGAALIQRRGSSNTWVIGDVAVLPAYRRRGIARELILATLRLVQSRGGKIATLEVIEGNLPAQRLYKKLGFEAYGSETLLDRVPPHPALPAKIPDGFTLEKLHPFDWRRRYEFERRVTPASYQAYEPVEEARFRQPAVMRFLQPLLQRIQGREVVLRTLQRTESASTQAIYRISLPTRGIGLVEVTAVADAAQAGVCEAVARDCVTITAGFNLDARIEWTIPDWMPGLIQEAEAVGFVRKFKAIRMGHRLI
jgi:ribosomal protein S18 acetylase RimI-like enzyme